MKILIIDDDSKVRQYLSDSLSELGYEVKAASAGEEGVDFFKDWLPDLTLVDLKMKGLDGLGVIEKIKSMNSAALIVMMTGYASVETAVEAMRRGAVDYISKPFDASHIDMIARNLREKSLQREALPSGKKVEGIVGKSIASGRVHELIHKVAASPVTILIQGESGTGKELVAGAIHRASARADQPFVTVDCGALSESLLESELFGHKKGAFTGAHEDRLGLIRSADKGTVFLDEVANLSPGLQAKFLRVIEERRVRPVGGDDSYSVDVRVIAATNRDLRWAIEEGSFRKDLYYRLDVVSINIPPLRERVEDIPLLIEHFLAQSGRGKTLDEAALELLRLYRWPGNVRELENVIEHAVTISSGLVIGVEDLPERLRAHEVPREEGYRAARKEAISSFDKSYIESILIKNKGNVTEAAKEMGISRRSLHEKMKDLGIISYDFKDKH